MHKLFKTTRNRDISFSQVSVNENLLIRHSSQINIKKPNTKLVKSVVQLTRIKIGSKLSMTKKKKKKKKKKIPTNLIFDHIFLISSLLLVNRYFINKLHKL